MAEHCTKSQIARFSVSALPAPEIDRVGEHLADCEICHQVLVESLKSQRGTHAVTFSLDPKFLFRHDHLDYEQLVSITENKLDEAEREVIHIHLSACPTCTDDLGSFQAFREQLEPQLLVRYGPAAARVPKDKKSDNSRLFGLRWSPIYTAALVLAAIGLIAAIVVVTQRSGFLETRRTESPQFTPTINPTPIQGNQVATNGTPTPAPVPTEQPGSPQPSPALTVNNRPTITSGDRTTVAQVRDERRTVGIDKRGNVFGLDDIPEETRKDIVETLTAQTLKTPSTNDELAGAPISLRGPDKTATFKLLSPGREVLLSDRPSFSWEKLSGASSYRVVIGDLTGHEIARSEELPADQTSWTSPKPLKRGDVYTWEVEAIVNGKKVHAPGTSQTQMKFIVLSDRGVRELDQLKTANSHLALGVFYAHEGMLTEAEHEFQILIRKNPKSPIPKKLLGQIQSWNQR